MFVIAAVLFLAVLARITVLQTVQADELRLAGKSQRTTEQRLKAHRGTIFDRDGADLALSVPARTITANPKLVLDPVGTVRTLTALLQLTPEKQQSLTEAFTSKKNSFVYVARQIDTQLAQTIASLGLAGVTAINEDKRILPSGDVGRSVVGRTDPDLEGTGGLEKEYNDILRGVDGEQSHEHDRKFRSIAGGDETVAPIPGSDIVLTLDRGLQYQVEKALLQRVEALTAVGGTAIVLGSKTGDIYASANVRRRQRWHRRGDVGQPGRHRRARARFGGQGVQPVGGGQRGPRHTGDDDRRARLPGLQAGQQERREVEVQDPRRRAAQRRADEPARHHRPLVEHRHRADHRRTRHVEVRPATCTSSGSAPPPVSACPTRAPAS